MKKKFIIALVISLLLITGCSLLDNKKYKISDVSLEKTDLTYSGYFNANDNLKIYYTVSNNAEVTLSSKIEVKLNESCFARVYENKLGDIPPKQSTRTYTVISINSYNSYSPNDCAGKIYPITIILKDINGYELDSKTVNVGIVK